MIDIARDNLLSLRDVARRLDVKTRTVRNWVKSGKLYAVQVGGSWYTNEHYLNAMAKPPEQHQKIAPPSSYADHTLAANDQLAIQQINALLGQTG